MLLKRLTCSALVAFSAHAHALSDCEKYVKYVRSVAYLQQIGMSREELHTPAPNQDGVLFPIQDTISAVWVSTEPTPEKTAQKFLAMCERIGYNNLWAGLREIQLNLRLAKIIEPEHLKETHEQRKP